MSRSGNTFRILVTAAGLLGAGAALLGGCSAGPSPRDEFFRNRSGVYGSKAGDGSVVSATWPGPQLAGKGAAGSTLADAGAR
jgi:hypothetical protein